MSGRIHKLVRGAKQEEVVLENLLRLAELLLRLLKIKVDVQGLDEVGDGVAVLVALLPDYPDEVLELLLVLVRVAALAAVGDNGGGEVAQDPGAVGLDGVDVRGREEHVGEGLTGGLVVEEGEQRPVDQPCAVLQLCEGVVEEARIDGLLELVDLLNGRVPVDREDLTGELAPRGLALLVIVGGLSQSVLNVTNHVLYVTYQNAESVQQLSSVGVDTAAVLEAAELVELVDHLDCDAVRILQVLQVLHLVRAQVGDDILIVQQAGDLARFLLQLVASLDDFLALLCVLGGHVVEVVHVLVELPHEVGHVGGLEQLQQHLLLLERLFGILVCGEVEQRVDEMAVEVGHQLGEEAVLLGDVAAVGRCVGHVGWLWWWCCRWRSGRGREFPCRLGAVVGFRGVKNDCA
jgi:hypothetical protein